MRADAMNMGMWRTALFAIGASALIAGCATDEASQDPLPEGLYAVTGLDLSSCSADGWVKSSTSTKQLVITASGDGYAVQACTDASCGPASPSTFAWSADAWHGKDGGAYLVETGCLLNYVDATVAVDGDHLVIEATRWSANLAGGSCTYDEVMAMREGPCADRIRLFATVQ